MHFGTIGSKKSKRKLSLEQDYIEQNSSFRGYKEKKLQARNRLYKTIAISSFIGFFVLLFFSLSLFGSDNYYTIKRGEDLEKIARKFDVPQKILLNLNNLSKAEDLKEGMRLQIPFTYDIYTAKQGDTLYSIAKDNGIKRYELASHNKFLGDKEVKTGDLIHIPRILSDISIRASKTTGLKPFKVEFSVVTKTRGKVKQYRWDMGDGSYSNKTFPIHTYEEKGIYNVRLDIIDENNNEITSNLVSINVRALANIKFTDEEFFEVNSGDIIDLKAEAIDNLGDNVDFDYDLEISGFPKLLEQIGRSDKLKVMQTGFATIKVKTEGYEHQGHYFVSPKPSKFVSRSDVNWYKTQFKTGLNGNCGPACTAMSIIWATGKDVKVSAIRNYIGLPYESGAVGFNHISMALERYRIRYKQAYITSAEDIFNIIDRDNIAILLFNMGKISKTKNNPTYDLFGTYYEEEGGHYVVVKGYSLDKKHFIVQDPMPGDWWRNKDRYADGISMLGRNRYYAVPEMMNALKINYVMEIER